MERPFLLLKLIISNKEVNMENYTSLTFNVRTTDDQRRTLSLLNWVSNQIVIEAIVMKRNYKASLTHSKGPFPDLGKFDKIRFLDDFLDDKGYIYPFSRTHISVLLGAVHIASNIIHEPGSNQKVGRKIPGEYQLSTRGGVSFSFNAAVNSKQREGKIDFKKVDEKNDINFTFKPTTTATLPHLGEVELTLKDEKKTVNEVNKIFENYRPTYVRFNQRTKSNDHENYWIASITFIHKAIFVRGNYLMKNANLDIEPFIERTAYHERLHRAKNRDHTSDQEITQTS